MKNCILIFLLLFVNSGFAQTYKESAEVVNKEDIYKSAKQEFEVYEELHGNFIETPNAKIHYLTWGKPSNMPLIWSHGSFSNSYELLNVADDLADAGYYVIAIDYYGHGQSSLPEKEVSLYHIADDIKYIMDHLEIDKSIIGGWSRGGYISTAFYDAYPESTLALILEDGGSVATNFNYHRLNQDSLDGLVNSFGVENFVEADTAFKSEKEAFFSIYNFNEEETQFQLLAWIREVEKGSWAANPELFDLFHHCNTEQILDAILRPTKVPLFAASMSILEPRIIFRNLDIPMLILDPISRNDLFPFEQENKKLQERFPDLIDHKIYKNTGHNIHEEHPKQFVHDLAEFLKWVKEHPKNE